MADVKDLNKLTVQELLDMADRNDLQSKLSAPLTVQDNKDTIVNALSAVATPEMAAEALELKKAAKAVQDDPALTPADPTDPEQTDPALVPPADDAVNNDIAVDDEVYFPYAEAEGGYRRSRVTAVTETDVEVIWVDGSRKFFSRTRIRRI